MKSTKKAFVSAFVALIICFTMLVGTTLAWFTDSANVGVQTITTGTLDIAVQSDPTDETTNMEGSELTWQAFDGRTDIYWEPGATYETNEFYIVNNGNLNLKFKITLGGISGDTELLDVLTFDILADASSFEFDFGGFGVVPGSSEFDLLEGFQMGSNLFTEYGLNKETYVGPLKVVAHMSEEAGNEYTNKALTGIGLNLIATQAIGDQDSYDGLYDEEAQLPDFDWYTQNLGAEEFTLTEPDQIDGLSYLVNNGYVNNINIKLGADIDLNGVKLEPIGTESNPFVGTFNGNGTKISNLTIESDEDYVALFNYVGEDATIKNVELENVNVSGAKYAAGVIGDACNADGLTVENVKVSGNISGGSYAAGIIFDAESENMTFKNCENNATVTAKRSAGIIAWSSTNPATVENCVNNGKISGQIGASGIAHAFCGEMKNCVNNGEIESAGVEPASGIAGVQKGVSVYNNCVNYGKVTSTADNPNSSAAGILGHTPGTKATFNYCKNFGDITAEQSYASGIAYSLYGSIVANYCYNAGDINGADGAGGIAAKAQYGAGDKANYCLNAGVVTSATKAINIANNETYSFYYDGNLLKNKEGNEVEINTALATLNTDAISVFFKIESGKIVA